MAWVVLVLVRGHACFRRTATADGPLARAGVRAGWDLSSQATVGAGASQASLLPLPHSRARLGNGIDRLAFFRAQRWRAAAVLCFHSAQSCWWWWY